MTMSLVCQVVMVVRHQRAVMAEKGWWNLVCEVVMKVMHEGVVRRDRGVCFGHD